jgi:hypothetical protein
MPKNKTTNLKNKTTNPKGETTNPKDQITEPNDAIKNIYKLVKPFLKLLLINNADLKGITALDFINDKIKAENQNDVVSLVNRWTIDRGDLF